VSPDPSTPVVPTEYDRSAPDSTENAGNRQGIIQRDRRVYVVDDDASVCDSLVILLETYGFDAVGYASGAALLADWRHREMGCLIIDQHMPELDGLEVLEALRREGIFIPTIVLSGRLDAAITEHAGKLGFIAMLEKPPTVARLVELVRGRMEERR
jgi:two-component system, LuxR family, response regulator FixJ